jgi:hypothetical protein
MDPSLLKSLLDPVEESQVSNANTKKCVPSFQLNKLRLAGLLFIFAFVIPGVVLPCVGFSDYRSAKAKNPGQEFESPGEDVIVLHILFVVCMSVSAFFGLADDRGCCSERHSWSAFFMSMFLGIVMYAVYTTFFFESPEFSAVTKSWTIEEYEHFADEMRSAQPQAVLKGSTSNKQYSCSTRNILMTAVSSTDASLFPNVTEFLDSLPAVFLRIRIRVEWDAQTQGLLDSAESVVKGCTPGVGIHSSISVDRWNTVVGIEVAAVISEDGQLPTEIKSGRAISAGIFWSGLYHCFKVDSIPSVEAVVVKQDGRIVGGLSCRDVSWTCSEKDSD